MKKKLFNFSYAAHTFIGGFVFYVLVFPGMGGLYALSLPIKNYGVNFAGLSDVGARLLDAGVAIIVYFFVFSFLLARLPKPKNDKTEKAISLVSFVLIALLALGSVFWQRGLLDRHSQNQAGEEYIRFGVSFSQITNANPEASFREVMPHESAELLQMFAECGEEADTLVLCENVACFVFKNSAGVTQYGFRGRVYYFLYCGTGELSDGTLKGEVYIETNAEHGYSETNELYRKPDEFLGSPKQALGQEHVKEFSGKPFCKYYLSRDKKSACIVGFNNEITNTNLFYIMYAPACCEENPHFAEALAAQLYESCL